ncbi:hypothetical protein [Cryptosporangium japonicum]|uniref:Uncharacterized protein n=1 Tax=Cryptosporangium japonicum TaxID=80872 RepID=A0ABN0V7I4_9ACTN
MIKALVVTTGLVVALGAAPALPPADGTTPGAPTDQKTTFPDGPPVVVGGGKPTLHQL